MVWILLLAALAAHVSCYDFNGAVLLTQEDFCSMNRITQKARCESVFQNYLVAYPQFQRCSSECPFYSQHCDILPLNVQDCSVRYTPSAATSTTHKMEANKRFGSPMAEAPAAPAAAAPMYEAPDTNGPLHSKVMSFSLELFKRALPDDNTSNFVLSPLMAQSLLSYLIDGASNGTRQAMESVLQLTNANLRELQRILEPSLETVSKNKLDIASRIFRSTQFELLEPFTQSLARKQVKVEPTDFASKEYTIKKINDWVRQKTRGKILDIVDPASFASETQLLLLNAIYFNGTWLYKFNKTEKGIFEREKSERLQARMMHLTRNLRSGYTRARNSQQSEANEGFLWVELPYAGDTVSMVLLLPKERFQLNRELRKFTVEDLELILEDIATNDQDEVRVQLPEFRAESTISLVDPLKRMGLSSAFDGDNPFDRMSNDSVKISAVTQKSFITVNPDGTVATTVTFATVIPLSLPRSTEFHANQPFAAIIVDKENKLPLFMARISRPKQLDKKDRKHQ